jgi:hypothetical protein
MKVLENWRRPFVILVWSKHAFNTLSSAYDFVLDNSLTSWSPFRTDTYTHLIFKNKLPKGHVERKVYGEGTPVLLFYVQEPYIDIPDTKGVTFLNINPPYEMLNTNVVTVSYKDDTTLSPFFPLVDGNQLVPKKNRVELLRALLEKMGDPEMNLGNIFYE